MVEGGNKKRKKRKERATTKTGKIRGFFYPDIQTPTIRVEKFKSFPKSLLPPSLLLLYLFITFIFSSTLALHHERLALYATTLNDERRATLFFSPSCPSLTYHGQHLPFESLLLFFLR
jgi:hypothetical protein